MDARRINPQMISSWLRRLHIWRIAKLNPFLELWLKAGSPLSEMRGPKDSIASGSITEEGLTSSVILIHQGKPSGRWLPLTITITGGLGGRVILTETVMLAVGAEIRVRLTRDE